MNANVFTLYRNFNEKGETDNTDETEHKGGVAGVLDEGNANENNIESNK